MTGRECTRIGVRPRLSALLGARPRYCCREQLRLQPVARGASGVTPIKNSRFSFSLRLLTPLLVATLAACSPSNITLGMNKTATLLQMSTGTKNLKRILALAARPAWQILRSFLLSDAILFGPDGCGSPQGSGGGALGWEARPLQFCRLGFPTAQQIQLAVCSPSLVHCRQPVGKHVRPTMCCCYLKY